MKRFVSRRAALTGAAAGLIGFGLTRLTGTNASDLLMDFSDGFNRRAQRTFLPDRPLAAEYSRRQISRNHPVNGGIGASYIDPNPAYRPLYDSGFDGWRLKIDGLVKQVRAWSLAELRALKAREQITMHCCDEGWSAIGAWRGVPLGTLLVLTGLLPTARYVVFHCMDSMGGQPLYTSIDLLDAFHPQTIIAYDFNGAPLPVGHGAPVRLRIELQIGYKNAKHIDRIEIVDDLSHIGKGRGGTFEDIGFQWYAGL